MASRMQAVLDGTAIPPDNHDRSAPQLQWQTRIMEAVATPVSVQTFRERVPTAGLAPYVACVWTQQVSRDAPPYPHRTAPNGSAALVCELGKPPKLIGPQTGPTEEMVDPETTTVGVRLRPGTVLTVLGNLLPSCRPHGAVG